MDAEPDDPTTPGREPRGEQRHVPVLLERCVDLLEPALREPGSVVVDATLGLGGHAEALLERCPGVRLVGLDRDPQALAEASARLAPHADRVDLVRTVFDGLVPALADLGVERVQGVLFDLGVSSLQLDEVGRGFSYARDAPLDMRMDGTEGTTAAEVLATYSAADLARVLRDFGEERFARRIADRVVAARGREPLRTTQQLVDLVRDAVPAATRRTGGNPAKRTFQALRVEVNGELEALRAALPAAVDALAVGGRVVVMSYQSLEDRIAKQVLAAGAASTSPPDLPVELPEHAPLLRLLTRGAETAPETETARNPRAASVRLRAAVRVRGGSLRRSAA
ncbi:16S rRNA (cytosine(1402)-N(4))-methyltransferase RsmH [Pseudokineococcus basanitobsidens]|uniref:Ribosomal RNA small subunit methyltransferase H n=1 Tax=Pseudokineococcus basanitobsidens TaxID=1926649 RepID=A0ABU8RHM8_9ACTN